MKQLVTLMAIGALAFAGYKYHTDQIRAAAEQAAAEARAQAQVPRAKAPKPAPPLDSIALARALESLYKDLFSSLELNRPADLVPPLETVRERILDLQTHADAEKRLVYAQGNTLVDAMIDFAEERTKALEALLRGVQRKGSLDSPTTTSTTSAFFAQAAAKRWEDEKNRRKPAIDQLMARLRNAEREWNKRVAKDAYSERYEFPDSTLVYINIDASIAVSNPLERRAYDQKRVIYPWRRAYYDSNGYPQYAR